MVTERSGSKEPSQPTLPWFLAPEEVVYLCHELQGAAVLHELCGAAEVTGLEYYRRAVDANPLFIASYATYVFTRARGWIPKPGAKFGCEFGTLT